MKILNLKVLQENQERSLQSLGIEVVTKTVSHNQIVNYCANHDFDGLLVDANYKITTTLLDQLNSLKFIIVVGKSLAHIPFEYAKKLGIQIYTTEQAYIQTEAELIIAHSLSCLRNLKDCNREMPLEGDIRFNQMHKLFSQGDSLWGQTWGFLGFDAVAERVVQLLQNWGVKFMVAGEAKPYTTNNSQGQNKESSIEPKSCSEETLYREADIISVHKYDDDEYLIDASSLNLMKKTAGIINTYHPRVIDEVALIDALNDEKIGFAALDVFENQPKPEIQLLMQPRISLSPNIANHSKQADYLASKMATQQIINIFENLKK
ncbi:NAD(P)-dependent oxidoreductase [uncultured Mesonia sp.]|uniref:NAD(P)-dependent oxidoreductase n=1 Tax=uncultured Mesonia sp. TaxID=399731 RepID=UPI00374FBFC8